jgi:hypothetical protein
VKNWRIHLRRKIGCVAKKEKRNKNFCCFREGCERVMQLKIVYSIISVPQNKNAKKRIITTSNQHKGNNIRMKWMEKRESGE